MTPTQHIDFLGFTLDSLNMTISVTEEKKGKIREVCEKLLTNRVHTIRFLAGVVGTLVAALPGITWGPLFYRALEGCKDHALRLSKGDFDTPVMLSSDAVSDLEWWNSNILGASNFIHPPPIDFTIYSDASLEGWGGINTT